MDKINATPFKHWLQLVYSIRRDMRLRVASLYQRKSYRAWFRI